MARRHQRPAKQPIYIGCEGQSEVAYAGLLESILRDKQLGYHLVTDDLGRGAGSLKQKVRQAHKNIKTQFRNYAFKKRYVILDADVLSFDESQRRAIEREAAAYNIVVIWQRPCFEAVLLNHIEGCEYHEPSDSKSAEAQLKKQRPAYSKPPSITMLKQCLPNWLQSGPFERGARRHGELGELLRFIGVID
jgi:RloB-like protein